MKKSWEIGKLGEVTKLQGGSQPPKSTFLYEPTKGYIRLLQIRDFKSDEKAAYIPVSSKNRTCEKEDILIGRYGASVGKICTGKAGAYNVALMKATPDREILIRRYFMYYLNSPLFQNLLVKVSDRSAQNGFNKDDVFDFPVPIPPLEEQKQIEAILDQAFEAIDKAKANIEKNIENAGELFQSKLNEIFSQKSEGWEEKKFKEICVLQRGFDLPKRLREKGNYDLVTSSGVKDSHSEYKVEGPGVVTGRSGSIGNVFFIENNFWPLNTALYIKDFKGNSEKYIYYFLKNFDLSKYSSGAGVPTLNRNFVHDETVQSTSNLEMQEVIVEILDSLFAKSEETVGFYNSKLVALEELKKSILQKAFLGELTQKEMAA